jgi:hypothetical protein
MPISVTLPDELASQVRLHEDDLAQILALGLREWNARQQPGFAGLSSVMETLARLPAPQEVLSLRPSPEVQGRIEELLKKKRDGRLCAEEQKEWDQYQYVEHLVRLAKAQAVLKLQES